MKTLKILNETELQETLSFTPKQAKALISDLTSKANAFLEEHFNMNLNIPIRLDGRLECALGEFKSLSLTGTPLEIVMNKKVAILCFKLNLDYIYKALYHECVHYALHVQGFPDNDGDEFFERTLANLNVPSSDATRVKYSQAKLSSVVVVDTYTITDKGKVLSTMDKKHCKVAKYSGIYDVTIKGKRYPNAHIERSGFKLVDLKA